MCMPLHNISKLRHWDKVSELWKGGGGDSGTETQRQRQKRQKHTERRKTKREERQMRQERNRERETGEKDRHHIFTFLFALQQSYRESFLHQTFVSFFLKFVFIFKYVHVSILRYVPISARACGGRKRTSDTWSWSYRQLQIAWHGFWERVGSSQEQYTLLTEMSPWSPHSMSVAEFIGHHEHQE